MNKVILGIMVGVAVTTRIMLDISTKRKIDKLNERIDDPYRVDNNPIKE